MQLSCFAFEQLSFCDTISEMPVLIEKFYLRNFLMKISHCVLVVPMQPTIGQRVRAVKTLAPNELDWD